MAANFQSRTRTRTKDEHEGIQERGILFRAEMVRAILEGRKTQTRRVINPQPIRLYSCEDMRNQKRGDWFVAPDLMPTSDVHNLVLGFAESYATTRWMGSEQAVEYCPYGKPGDRLWVRENFYIDHCDYLKGPLSEKPPLDNAEREGFLYYPADDLNGDVCRLIPECQCDGGKPTLRPAIHMPRWASRITLEVLKVRVERVQEIKWHDAIAEGMKDPNRAKIRTSMDHERGPVPQFQKVWNSMRKGTEFAWEENPWVWAVEFFPRDSGK